MPFVYNTGPAANVTTHATPDTETDHIRFATGTGARARVQGLYLTGKGAGLTAISGIIARLYRYATASTAGSAITPRPRDPLASAAVLTAFTGPTVGTTATLQQAVGCGAAGPGGWVARDDDSMIMLEGGGGANGNLDMHSACGTASRTFEYSIEHRE
jgi:hypothetical protein